MLNTIIQISIRNKLIIGLFIIGLIGYGSYQLTKLPIDAVPDITNNQVQVITVAPSFGATDIERLITFPIEQANNNIAGLKEIRSFSRFGLSLVTIVFDDATDVYWARQQVAERLQQIQNQIPKGIGTPELGPVTTGLGEIYQYVVRPKKGYEQKYNETDLRTIQDWIIRRQLLGVKGVAEVSSFGGKLQQFSIEINTNKLAAYQISIQDVFTALEKNNQNTGGAYIEKASTVLYIRSEGLIGSINDLENIPIKTVQTGTPLFIRDVASVKIGAATRYGALTYNDKGEVAGAIVMMLKGANSSEVIKNVKERVAKIQKTLPEGIVIEPFLDRTKMVNNAIGTVEKNLLEGALIVIFVLVMFLGNIRAGLLVASVIPLSMLFAVIMMNLFGVSGNLMSLGALDFGLIVDGAVIIVEAVMHQLTHSKRFNHIQRLTQSEMDTTVQQSASKMMNSAVFGQIIILIVYLPIFTLQGIEGKMFKPMAQTVAFALLGAFILSLTYIPMMSSIFLSKKIQHQPNFADKLMGKVERKYQAALQLILGFPKSILGIAITLFITSLLILSTLGGEFIPALEEGDFAVETRVLSGSNLNTTIENTTKAAGILKQQFPEVQKVVTKIGSGEVPTDPMPMDACDMMVILKPKSEWTSASTFDELSEKMTESLSVIPGLSVGFQYPVQMRFNELMTGARQDVVCKIFGENLDTLAKYATILGNIANTVNGATNLFVEPISGLPQVIIEYNRNALAQYNLNIEEVNKVVNTAFAGESAGLLFDGEKRFEIVVKLAGEQRKNIEDVQQLLIPTKNGTQIPLYQVANVVLKEGPNQIQREDAKRRIVVGFNVRGRDVQSIVNELQEKAETKLKLPVGYYITYGGAFENLNAAKQRLLVAVPVSLLLIFLLLFFAFNSVKQGLLIYSAIPLSAIGGILSLAARGMPFSISAGIGFIALFGVAVLNGIVLIAEFNRLKEEGLTDVKRIVLIGTKVRLRPVLMTAFVASLGFLPMALSNGAGAEVQRPLATVVIGGLLMATFLTLFVLPVLYIVFENGMKFKKIKSNISTVTIFVLMGCFATSTQAQKSIGLQAAMDTAIKNNLQLKNEQLKIKYQSLLIQTSKSIAPTDFTFEAGQMNSVFTDTKISIAQNLTLPIVYKRQKELFTSEMQQSILQASVKTKELKQQVAQVYFEYLFLLQKQQLLLETKRLFNTFLERATERLAKGETNVLEKTFASNQLQQLNIQLHQVNADIDIMQLQMQLLLNTTKVYQPIFANVNNQQKVEIIDTTQLLQHPVLQQSQQLQQIANANTQLAGAQLLPSFQVGINNTSIRGVGADEKSYAGTYRFNSFQVGASIPVFNKWLKAKVQAAKMAEQIAVATHQQQVQQFTTAQKMAFINYQQQLKMLDTYSKELLPNAKNIEQTAEIQLQSGSINYLEWVQLMHQVITIRSEYIQTEFNKNKAFIQLQYYNQP